MKKFNKVMAIALVGLMTIASAGCSSKSNSSDASSSSSSAEGNTEESGKLIMATNAEFPPYEYYDGDSIVGIDVEIAQAIAETMGKELVIDDIAFDSIIPAVTSGKADIGLAGMTVTEDRLVNVDFSDTYCQASQVIIVRKDNTEITTPDDLVGKKIGVQLGTTGDIYSGDIEGAQVERFSKGFEAVLSLQQGKLDAVVIDDQVAKAFADANSDVVVIEEPFTQEEYAIAVNKGNEELLTQLNDAIKELKESGKLDEIVAKYISAE